MGGPHIKRHVRIRDELPAALRKQVDRMLLDGSSTYDDIRDFLAAEGSDISRSAVGRYGRDFLATLRELRTIEEQSRTMVSEAGDELILEEMAAKLFLKEIVRLQLAGQLDVKQLPRIISDFAKLQSSIVSMKRFKADVSQRAEKALENITERTKMQKRSLDPETLRIIKEEIYGLV